MHMWLVGKYTKKKSHKKHTPQCTSTHAHYIPSYFNFIFFKL